MHSELGFSLKKYLTVSLILLVILIIIVVILSFTGLIKPSLSMGKTIAIQTRINDRITTTDTISPSKNIWDLIQLILAPFVLIFISIIYSDIQKQRDQERESERNRLAEERQVERNRLAEEIAAEDRYENALVNYFNSISDLLLNHRLLEKEVLISAIATSRTRTTVRFLDGGRRGKVITFLHDTGLLKLESPIVSAYKLTLYGADLLDVRFKNANLKDALLDNSDFRGAVFDGVDLTDARMRKTILRNADFTTSILNGARLEGALYDYRTKWPEGFDYKNSGAIYQETRESTN